MELELGLKITRTREDVSSSVDFRFSKDPLGPLVLSRETNSIFIIIIQLKGFKKEGIEIEINEEGNRITISGRKPVEEMVLIRWMVWRKEVELRAFKKVFLIPHIVDLDKIKARFDDDDSTLTITMSKRVKGIYGFNIEEEEEVRRVDFGDVSAVENIEEIENGEGVEEKNVEREKSEDKERERHVLEEEEETEDKSLEFVEEETISSKQKLADLDKESEDNILRKLPHINQEVTKQQDSQEEHRSDDLESRSVEEIDEQEFQGQKGHGKQEKIKELVEEKTPKAETKTADDTRKPVQETEVPHVVQEAEKNTFERCEGNHKEKEVDDISRRVVDIQQQKRRNEETKIQNMVKEIKSEEEKKKTAKMEFTNGNSVGDKMRKRFNIRRQEVGETDEAKYEKIDEMVEKKEDEEEEINNLGQKSEERKHSSLKKSKEFETDKVQADEGERKNQREEYEEKNTETRKKTTDAGSRKVQEIIRQQELDEPARYEKGSKNQESVKLKTIDEEKEEKEIVKTETESHRPKVLEKQEKIQELDKENSNFSRKVKAEEEEIAEKKEEYGEDDGNIEQRDSDAMKGQKEKDKIQDLAMLEKVGDRGKDIMVSVAETINENVKSRKVQEIDEKQSQEVDKRGKQFKKLIEGETSDRREEKDEANEKKTIETEERIINKETYLNDQEEEKKDEPGIVRGTTEHELVNLNNQLEQDDIQEQEKTQELLEDKPKDCKEEESETKTDDVARKVQDSKENELYEPRGDHVSKIKERVAEKEIEAECGGLSKVHGSEEQKLHEPKIHKERDKTRITKADEPSGQKKEEEKMVESLVQDKIDGTLRKIQDGEDPELRKPYKRQEEHKIQELAETGTPDYREIIKKQDGNDILRRQEAGRPDRDGEQSNIPRLVETFAEPKEKLEDDNSGKLHEFEERKSYEDWVHEEREKYFVKEEATNPKDQHSGGEGHEEEQKEAKVIAKEEMKTKEDSSKKVQEVAKEEYGDLERSTVQDKMQETQEKEKSGAMEENEILKRGTKAEYASLRKFQEGRQEESEEAIDEDKNTGQKEKERHEKGVQTKTKLEYEMNKKLGKHKELHKLEGVLREGESEREKEENLEGDFTTQIQDNEKEESREAYRHKKLEIVQDLVRNETENQEDDKPEEAAAEMVSKEKDSSRKLQTLNEHELKESEEHAEQYKILKKRDTGVEEEDQEAHVQELEGSCKHEEGRRGEKGQQRKIIETISDNRIQETIAQEPNKKKYQEPRDKIEELERQQQVMLVIEDDNFSKRQEFLEKESKRLPVEQENIQELEKVNKREDEEEAEAETKIKEVESIKSELQGLDKPEENKEHKKIQKPMVEKTNAPEKVKVNEGNEKNKEEEMQDKIQDHKDMNERGRYNAAFKEDSGKSQGVQEKLSDQEHEKEYGVDKREKGEQTEKIMRVKPKANDDDSSRKSEIEEQESIRLREQKKRVEHQQLVEIETNDQSKEDKTKAEYDRSHMIQDNEEERSDKREKINRKEGTEARDDGCRKVKEIEEQELVVTYNEDEKKQEVVKKDTSGQAKVKKDQETKNTYDSSRNVKDDEKQEAGEQDKNLGLVAEKKNDWRNQESGNVDNSNGSRKAKEVEEIESNENMFNQEEGENESTNKDIEAKPKDYESTRLVRPKEQDKTRKPGHQKTVNCKDEETANKETKSKGSELRKKLEKKEHETSEQIRLEGQETSKHMRLQQQERIQKLLEDGNSKKIQEIEKEPGRDKNQEPVVLETSEDDEEELEIEYEESEEDWEAEVIQEMDSDEDNDEIRQIKRIKLGCRLVGGSTLFMSLIVIVISLIRSKKEIRCSKF